MRLLLLAWFNNFALTTGFYWSFTLLLSRPFLCTLVASYVCVLLGTTEIPDASGSSPAAKKRKVDASNSETGNAVRVPCFNCE